MTVKKFDISQAGEAAEYLGKSIEHVADRAVMSVANKLLARILTVIIPREPRQPVDRGAYRAAWRVKKVDGGAELRNDMPYAAPIEHGVRGENVKIGRKMIEALAAWVLRKGLVKSGRSAGAKAIAKAKAISMAWAIAKKMKEKGIFDEGKGLHILDKACDGLEQLYVDAIGEEMGREFSKR